MRGGRVARKGEGARGRATLASRARARGKGRGQDCPAAEGADGGTGGPVGRPEGHRAWPAGRGLASHPTEKTGTLTCGRGVWAPSGGSWNTRQWGQSGSHPRLGRVLSGASWMDSALADRGLLKILHFQRLLQIVMA